MASNTAGTGVDRYFDAIRALQEKVIASQRATLIAVANRMAAVIRSGGRIFVFGTGHSHLMVEEGFFRAGGLAAVTPVFSSALMLHENPVLSSQLERTPDLAATLLDHYNPQMGEMIFVYSNSGVNQMPVEMAQQAQRRGLTVVAVCSQAYAQVAPLSTLGVRLAECADFVLDNGGMPGDALVAVEGLPWRVGPSSTLVNALLWNCLVTETTLRMMEDGSEPPVIASLNMAGAAEHNEALLAKWRKVNPHL